MEDIKIKLFEIFSEKSNETDDQTYDDITFKKIEVYFLIWTAHIRLFFKFNFFGLASNKCK